MNIKPIEIDIEDKMLYAQIAFLVDRSDFLQEIAYLRTKFNIDSSFQQSNYFETASDDSLSSLTELKAQLLPGIAKLRDSYKYPPYFDDVIFQVIMFNRVQSIKSTQVVMRLVKDSEEQKLPDQNMELAILLTPLSTKQEVMSAFEEAKKLRSEYENKHLLSPVLDKDTLTNIRRDRKWYLQKLSGKTYKEIVDEWNNTSGNSYIEEENDVTKAVSRYKKTLLSSSKG